MERVVSLEISPTNPHRKAEYVADKTAGRGGASLDRRYQFFKLTSDVCL